MHDDWQQLETYLTRQRGADAAFAQIVDRYINLVFSAALRQVNDRSAAEEVTQAVFILLANKAHQLKPTGSLGGWLYNAASLKAKEHLRSDLARRKREQKAHDMSNIDTTPDTAGDDDDSLDWDRVAPLLDTAMGELPQADREAVLMRYFQDRPLREVGAVLGVSEEAARKRVSRAVDRLRGWFADRGVAFGATALTTGLISQAVEAAPAHLAGTTVQAVAAQSAAAAASTGGLLTSMASTKFTAIAAVLIGAAVPISLAYVNAPPAAEPRLPIARPAAVSIEIPQPSESELVAEWKRLRTQFGPDLGSMPELYQAVKEIDDDFRRRAFRGALLAEWALLDGDDAVAYLRENDRGRLTQLFTDWLKSDPDRAIAALAAGGGGLGRQIESLIGEIAKVSPESLPGLAAHVKRDSPWDLHVAKAFALFAGEDFAAARKMAESMGGDAAGEALAGVAGVWVERDGAAAFEWVQGLEDDTARGRAMQGLLVGWAKSDPLAALERIELAPPGGMENSSYNTASRVVAAAAEVDFELVVDWLSKQVKPSHDRSGGFKGISDALGERFMSDVAATLEYIESSPAKEPLARVLHGILLNQGYAQRDAVWDWIKDRPISEFSEGVRMSLLRSAAWKDPDLAINWLESLPPDADIGDKRWGMASALINGGSDIERLDGLLDRITEGPLRTGLLQAGLMRPDATLDTRKWVGRIDELPADARPEAMRSLAFGLQDPQSAIEWVGKIVADSERQAAFRGLAQGWAGADSWEASEWIAGLEHGDQRDNAIVGLVEEIASQDPDAAWEWANSTDREESRHSAVSAAIFNLASKNPELAQQRLDESGDLPEKVRAPLEQAIEFERSRRYSR